MDCAIQVPLGEVMFHKMASTQVHNYRNYFYILGNVTKIKICYQFSPNMVKVSYIFMMLI